MSHKSDVQTFNYRPDIDGLRALAILLVVIFHAYPKFLRGGFVGVDIFFVISGYLIIGLLVRERLTTGRISLITFIGRTARRLIPASTLVLLVTTAFIWLMMPGLAGQRALDDVRSAAFYFELFSLQATLMRWSTVLSLPLSTVDLLNKVGCFVKMEKYS